MDYDRLRESLAKRGFDETQTEKAIETVYSFEEYLKSDSKKADDKDTLIQYCQRLIGESENTWHNIYSLALYGRLAGIEPLTINALELIDGAEAFGNLKVKLESELGETEARKYFDGVREPLLGESNSVRPEPMGTVIGRMVENLGQDRTKSMICNCLRDLDDSWYEADKKLFEECGKDIDKFIKARGDRFLAELETMKNEGRLYFTQPITDEVIEFVKTNPEIHYGVRDGNHYYDTKIPHQAAKMLAETDPVKRRYHYCHCPWVKESLKDGKSSVPPVFCNCSAGFHKRMWEVLLGHPVECEVLDTVLSGGDRCRFRVLLI
jgi:hypothetical protein